MIKSVIIIILVLLLVAFVCLLLMLAVKNSRLKKQIENIEKKISESDGLSDEQTYTTSEENFNTVIVNALKNHSSAFVGLYESLYSSCNSNGLFMPDAYMEWNDRIESIGDDALTCEFENTFPKEIVSNETECLEKMSLLIKYINAAGISRVYASDEIIISDDMACSICHDANGKTPAPDIRYRVFKPAWVLNEQVVEYGILIPKN